MKNSPETPRSSPPEQPTPGQERAAAIRNDLSGNLSRLRNAWALSALVNVGGMLGLAKAGDIHAEQERAAETRATQETEARERAAELARRQHALEQQRALEVRVEREQVQLIEQSLHDLQVGQFDYGAFVVEAGRLDTLEEGVELQTEPARAELARAQAVFDRVLGDRHDVPAIRQALEAAFANYEYTVLSDTTLPDFTNERRGPCRAGADFVATLLWRHGIRNIGFRNYAAPEGTRLAHLAPVIVIDHDGRREEVDLFSGGRPFTNREGVVQGTFIDVRDKIVSYAAYHHLPVSDVQPEYRRFPGHPQGYHFALPVTPPTVSEAFPTLNPLYARGFMHVYQSTDGGISQESLNEQEVTELRQDAFEDGMDVMGYLLYPPDAEPPTEHAQSFGRATIATRERLAELAESAEYMDTTLQTETSPARRTLLMATSACLWEVLSRGWAANRFARSYERAHHRAEEQEQALEELLSHISAQDFFPPGGQPLEQRYLYLVQNLLISSERGERLALGVATEISRRRSQTTSVPQLEGDGGIYAAVFVGGGAVARRTAAERIQLLSLTERTRAYLTIAGYQGDHLTVGLPTFEQELRFFGPLLDPTIHIQRVTGEVQMRSASQAERTPRREYIEGGIDEWRGVDNNEVRIEWHSLEELKRFFEVQAQEQHISPELRDVAILHSLARLSRSYTELEVSHRPERDRYKALIYPILVEARSWLQLPESQRSLAVADPTQVVMTRITDIIRRHRVQ